MDVLATGIAPLIGYAISMSGTPGPNNIMVAASGANFGWRRTLPHMLGVSLGHVGLILIVAAGLGALFIAVPVLQLVVKVVGCAYLLWLAWKIATSAAPETGGSGGAPLTFVQAAAFQWVNPKAWIAAIGVIASFARSGPDYWIDMATIAAVFTVSNFISVAAWTGFGTAIGRWLHKPAALRAFNWTMAGLLVLSLAAIFI